MSKILVIEDAVPLHAVIRVRLADDQLEFFSAYTGEEGLRLAQEVRPDLILLDMDLPDKNGFEVCRRLKNDPALRGIPVIFLSGDVSAEDKVKGLNLGAIDYITKPFDAAELQARVQAALRTIHLMDLLAKRAMIDGQTEVWNRSYFDHRLSTELAQFRRNRQPVSCIIVDIDHFRWINERHGHGFGDSVLCGIAKLIQTQTRAEDVACRYGGEQFSILTPNVDAPGAAVLAGRLAGDIVGHSFAKNGVSPTVTASFGVASVCDAGENFVERAVEAMRVAKNRGRDRIVVWSPELSVPCAGPSGDGGPHEVAA